MTTTPTRSRRARKVSILRFDGVQRVTHWVVAALFGVLMVTAIPLYFGSLFGIVLARHTIQLIHLWCGIALPVPILLSLLGPWGRSMRRDVRSINDWTRDEVRWLRTLGRSSLQASKFNPGQKLNTIFVGTVILIMLVTGCLLQWFRLIPVSVRPNVTFVHDAFSLAIFVVVAGHVVMALTHPDALRSIFTGTVSERWAARHAPRWLDELEHEAAGEAEPTG